MVGANYGGGGGGGGGGKDLSFLPLRIKCWRRFKLSGEHILETKAGK